MSKYDAIIFDVDGTLWDAREQVIKGWNIVYEQYTGKPGWLTQENFGAYFGSTLDDLVRIAFPGIAEDEIWPVYERCRASQMEVLRKEPGTLYPGVLETVPKLAQQYPLYILSNCPFGYIECLLDGCHLNGCFQGWMCYMDTYQPKNVNIKLLCEKYGLKNPVYVGDVQGDADACEKAGIPIIHAAYGLGEIENPVARIEKFSDLVEVLCDSEH